MIYRLSCGSDTLHSPRLLCFIGVHQSLSWATRIKVAIGVAKGLSFLHEKEITVMLGSFKTADILLDGVC